MNWQIRVQGCEKPGKKKTKDIIVAVLDVITPGDWAQVWDALQSLLLVDKELDPERRLIRNLEALAET